MGESEPRAVSTSAAGASALDPAALWEQFGPPLRGFLARRAPPGVDADDLVQEVFLRVIRGLATLRSTDRPEAWLFQIARNALRDSLRTRLRRDGKTDSLDDELPAMPDPTSDRAAEAELAPCLTGMIGRLAEPYRTAIALTSLQGLSQADAARQLGISGSGMKSRVQRGRAKLRHMLVSCCAIAVDVRGGVSDFHLRGPGTCGVPAPGTSAGACGLAPCTSHSAIDASNKDGGRLQDRGRDETRCRC
jgi:RNA polymerase sigma-70 factor, ECF subfamily